MERRDLDIICNSAVNWRKYLNKTFLVTGATGRLGRYLLETLVEVDLKYNLNMRIVGLARSEEKAKAVFGSTLDFPNVRMVYQDIAEPIQYDGVVDFIFHTAGPAAPMDYKKSPSNVLWAHVNGTRNVLECARTHHTKRVFYTSTVEVYGEWKEDRKIRESDMGPLQHLNFRACYPEAKRVCETMLAVYQKEFGISYCGVRMSHTLGPGVALDDGRGFAEFIQCVLDERDIVLHSDGSVMRTYTYVADAVNAMFLVMEKGEDGFYNVANDANLISIRDLAELIAQLSPSGKTKVLFEEEAAKLPYLPFQLAVLDSSRVKDLGWQPTTSLQQMFKWTIESFL